MIVVYDNNGPLKNKVLLVGSGLSAKDVSLYDKEDLIIVAVNNGYIATNRWKYWVRSGDFEGDRPKLKKGQQEIIYKNYNKFVEMYGGEKKCGRSIMLCASYWALEVLNPKEMYYLGADMNYTPDKNGHTHIYGLGYDLKLRNMPDPDYMVKFYGYGDPDYLNTVYTRFYEIAKSKNVSVYNLSNILDTRLPYPKPSEEKIRELKNIN
jgi:hypothetical protein